MTKTKAAAKKSQKAKDAEVIEPDGAPPPKKARGRKKSAKIDDEDDQGQSIAKEEDSGEPIPAPVKKSRASRKGATVNPSKIPEAAEDDDMEEGTEEAQKPKKGRKNTVGKGAKDEVSASASFLLDFRLTVGLVLRHLAPQRLKRTYTIRLPLI